jgi:hypothetical protein
MAFVFESKYKKAVEQYGVKTTELSDNAQIGIASIEEILRALNTLERKGKSPQARSLAKLKALDHWVYQEILDYVQDTDTNTDNAPVDPKTTVKEVKEEVAAATAAATTAAATKTAATKTADPAQTAATTTTAAPEPDQEGLEIEAELAEMHKSGRKDWDIESVQKVAKKTYKVLFDNYEDGQTNGVQTTHYSLIESTPKTFTLTKK